ncbi:MAG: hypothetical protein R3316_01670 [Rhodovibrionaceae bacterium]|nr:hypothetical protein [Rhodovibrionaceae bacterium]
MLKKFLTVVLPLLLPALLYILYMVLTQGRPKLREAPWGPIALAGVALVAVVLVTVRVMSGVEPGTEIQMPRYEDGRVVPSRPRD